VAESGNHQAFLGGAKIFFVATVRQGLPIAALLLAGYAALLLEG
jgi:hypothetical protein